MRTTLRFKVGLMLALLGLLTLTLNPPPLAFAQDEEPAAEVEAAQTTEEEEAEEPPVVEEEEEPAPEPPAEEPVEEPEPEPAPPVDTTAPSIDQPEDSHVKADDASGRVVEFSRPDADDDFDGDVPVDCAPGSGVALPPGDDRGDLLRVGCGRQLGRGLLRGRRATDQTAPSIDWGERCRPRTPRMSRVPRSSSRSRPPGTTSMASSPSPAIPRPAPSSRSGRRSSPAGRKTRPATRPNPVAFTVTVNALPEPTPTRSQREPTEEPTRGADHEPEPTDGAHDGADADRIADREPPQPTETSPPQLRQTTPEHTPTDGAERSRSRQPTRRPPTETPEKPTATPTEPARDALHTAAGLAERPSTIVIDGGPLGALPPSGATWSSRSARSSATPRSRSRTPLGTPTAWPTAWTGSSTRGSTSGCRPARRCTRRSTASSRSPAARRTTPSTATARTNVGEFLIETEDGAPSHPRPHGPDRGRCWR